MQGVFLKFRTIVLNFFNVANELHTSGRYDIINKSIIRYVKETIT